MDQMIYIMRWSLLHSQTSPQMPGSSGEDHRVEDHRVEDHCEEQKQCNDGHPKDNHMDLLRSEDR